MTMTEHNNHKLSDEELNDLIAGKGPLADAYQALDKPQPPEDLDARILAKARASVSATDEKPRDVFIRPYATAATVFLCLGITFLWLNEPSVPTPADSLSEEEIARQIINRNSALEETAPRAALQRAPAQEVQEEGITEQQQREQGQQQTQQFNAAAELAEAEAAEVSVSADTAPQDALNLDQLLDLVEERRLSDADPDRAPPQDRATQNGVAQDEVFITASRLEDAQPAYREDRDAWLQEIARLRAEGASAAVENEENLFLEAYPGTDIDAALEALDIP